MNLLYPYRHYLAALILLALITLVCHLFLDKMAMINIALIHLLPVIVIALRGNMIATMTITTFTIALLALFYIAPRYSFAVNELYYLRSFAIFYVVGYIITVQARKIQANSIKETLLNTLSHDLKTPLSSILGNTSLLLDQDKRIDAQTRLEVLTQIKESSQRMNRLISNLLDSARLQNAHAPLRREWCDFEDLLGVALQEFRNDVQQRRIETRIDPDLPLFQGDCNLLLRLLVNLLDNAIKYTKDERPVEVEITSSRSAITLVVTNRCKPIKKADLKNMFDRFYRLENTADIVGSGIGLSICKEIVNAHGGTIEAYNVEGGVSLKATLPLPKRPLSLNKADT